MTMFAMSLYALVSATIVITASTRAQILAGRTLNCMSCTHSEVAPSQNHPLTLCVFRCLHWL